MESIPSFYLGGPGSTPGTGTKRTPDGLPRQTTDLPPWADVLRADPCSYCGGPGGTVDHIAATGKRALRFLRGPLNGAGACVECNNLKSDISLLHFLLGERREDEGTASRKGDCPTGKRVYYQERLANRAITKALLRGELPPMRHYRCPECGWWHLSRKERQMRT